MIAQKKVDVAVGYGLGSANCVGTFERRSLYGVTARGLIERVISQPQPSPSSSRTAAVVRDVLRGRRVLDVELFHRPEDEMAGGTPINLDDVVVGAEQDESRTPEKDDVTLLISEPYQGGMRRTER